MPSCSVPTEREIAFHALAIERAADMSAMLCNHPGGMGVKAGIGAVGREEAARRIFEKIWLILPRL